MLYLRFIAAFGGVMFNALIAHAALPNDDYLAGYAASMLKHKLMLNIPSLIVRNGVIILPKGSLDIPDRSNVMQMLAEIPGVNAVKIAETDAEPELAVQAPVAVSPAQPAKQPSDQPVATVDTRSTLLPVGIMPAGHLFNPLLADPRWAHFSATYRHFMNNNFDGRSIASVSFGETIPIYRGNFGRLAAQWEAGLQGGVFSDFNLNAPSSDLINTDFVGSVYVSMRAKKFSAFSRIYHQSSHLGDEFLLRRANSAFHRINLSYEGIDLRLSYEFPYGVRLYGGGGGLIHKEPSSISARAGVEFGNLQALGRKLQLLIEYYNGNSSSG